VLALFNKAVRKLNSYLKAVVEADTEHQLLGKTKDHRHKAARDAEKMSATGATLDEDLKDGASDAYLQLTGKAKKQALAPGGGAAGAAAAAATALLLADDELSSYQVKGGDAEWESALARGGGTIPSVSMKSGKGASSTSGGAEDGRSVADRVTSAATSAASEASSVGRLLAEAAADREEEGKKGQTKKRRRILGGGFNELADGDKKKKGQSKRKKDKSPAKPEGKYKNLLARFCVRLCTFLCINTDARSARLAPYALSAVSLHLEGGEGRGDWPGEVAVTKLEQGEMGNAHPPHPPSPQPLRACVAPPPLVPPRPTPATPPLLLGN
jgi:hypothetical protein